MNGFGRACVRSGSARMGCTVSFICCEDDFLQMPGYQHEEEEEKKKKERLKKVRNAWREEKCVAVKKKNACRHAGVGVKTRS